MKFHGTEKASDHDSIRNHDVFERKVSWKIHASSWNRDILKPERMVS